MNKKMTKKQFYLLSCTWGIIMTLIGGIAFLGGKSKKLAIKEPTHAPVPGNGTATNKNNPSAV